MKNCIMYFLQVAFLISLMFSLLSCKHTGNSLGFTNPFPVPDTYKKPTEPPEPVLADIMKFEIVFNTLPAKVIAKPAKLKYNKNGWVSEEWDDNSLSALKALEKLKTKFYTDGCGNKIAYTAAIAVNGRSNYNNEEIGLSDNNITYTQMKQLIAAGWDIENHSYYHEPYHNFNFGNDRVKNIIALDTLMLKKINYKMNGLVVPSDYSGFPKAAKEAGYIFSTSQGTFDGLAPAGAPVYKDVQDFDLAPITFSAFNRMFYDNWTEMENNVKKAIDVIVQKNHHYFRFASHGIDEAAYSRIIDYFETKTNDKILFIPTREIMEYRLMTSLPISYQLSHDRLIIEINTASLPARCRWKDLSFIVSSDAQIKSVRIINGIDRATFNAQSGLVNIFKQITSWN